MLGKPPLIELIKSEISSKGPMPFYRFMELALYHPQHGYYSDSTADRVGRDGDFYTSVSVGALFGQLMAQQFEEMWEALGRPPVFHIIEQGANDARFAGDVLLWMKEWRPDLMAATQYTIIEPLDVLQARQKAWLSQQCVADKVFWQSNLESLQTESFVGVFFSNELVDSFPVHRIVYHDSSWLESHVVWDEDHFSWKNLPTENQDLALAYRNIPVTKIQNYTTEVNLEAQRWILNVARILKYGFVLTVDYGYLQDLYYSEKRIDGTLQCYHRHQRNSNPLVNIGEQDITSHVEFSALIREGINGGLKKLGFTDQHHFMIGLAHDDLANFEANGLHLDPHYTDTTRAFRTLMHPEIMGSSFKFLIQSKGLTVDPSLKGLKFARPT